MTEYELNEFSIWLLVTSGGFQFLSIYFPGYFFYNGKISRNMVIMITALGSGVSWMLIEYATGGGSIALLRSFLLVGIVVGICTWIVYKIRFRNLSSDGEK